MTIREVFNPSNHTWEPAPDWTIGRYLRYLRYRGQKPVQAITFANVTELATALKDAATAHHEYEQQTGTHDSEWHKWYADWVAREKRRETGRTD